MENTTNLMNTKKIILTGLMMALVTVATMVFIVPVPFTSGYIHLGDSMIFLSVLILGWRYGAVAAGVGSALADLFVGYANWAPWTLCIKGIMALMMGLAIEKCIKSKKNIIFLAMITAAFWGAFNFIVQRIIKLQVAGNPESLFSEDVKDLTALGELVNSVESQLMLVALLIPVFLVIIAIYIRKKEHLVIPVYQLLGMTLGGLWMVFGYYIAGGLMYGNFAVSAFSIPWNMVQFVIGFLIAALITAALYKTPVKKFFTYK
jgi:uncharacterized membrane protein